MVTCSKWSSVQNGGDSTSAWLNFWSHRYLKAGMGGCPGTMSGSRSRLANPHDRDRDPKPLPTHTVSHGTETGTNFLGTIPHGCPAGQAGPGQTIAGLSRPVPCPSLLKRLFGPRKVIFDHKISDFGCPEVSSYDEHRSLRFEARKCSHRQQRFFAASGKILNNFLGN